MENWIINSTVEEGVETIIFTIYKSMDDEDSVKINDRIALLNAENYSPYDEQGSRMYSGYWSDYWHNRHDRFFDYIKQNFKYYEVKLEDDFFRYLQLCYQDKIIYKIRLGYEAHYKNIKIHFCINSFDKYDNYDHDLERLKIATKNFWISETKKSKCYWVEDTQSQGISKECYSIIYNIENKLRSFISKVVIEKHIPIDELLQITGLIENYKKNTSYKAVVPNFSNIEDIFLSMNTDDLLTIMNYQKRTMEPGNDHLLSELIREISKKDATLQKIRDKFLKKTYDYWDKIFGELFQSYYINESGKYFVDNWKHICGMRNHVAHNKIIDYNFFRLLSNLANKLQREITKAEKELNYQIRYKWDSLGEIYFWDQEIKLNREHRQKEIHKHLCYMLHGLKKELSKEKTIHIEVVDGFVYKEFSFDAPSPREHFNQQFLKIIDQINFEEEVSVMQITIQDTKEELSVVVRNDASNSPCLDCYAIEVKNRNKLLFNTDIRHNGTELRSDAASPQDEYLPMGTEELSENLIRYVRDITAEKQRLNDIDVSLEELLLSLGVDDNKT